MIMTYLSMMSLEKGDIDWPSFADGVKVAPETSDPLRDFLSQHLPDRLAYDKDQRQFLQWLDAGKLRSISLTNAVFNVGNRFPGKSKAVDSVARVIFGIFGGLILLVPLVVLTFIQSNHYRLLATTFFTFAFVLFLAFFSKASNQELIATTAGYTAVLVVFVGSALSSGS